MHLHVLLKKKKRVLLEREKNELPNFRVRIKMEQKREKKKVGHMMKRLTCKEEEGKKKNKFHIKTLASI